MSIMLKVFFEAKQAEATQTTQYTAPSSTRAIIDKFTATNTTASPATLSVNIIASGGSSGDSNLIVQTKTLAAGETYTFPEIVGQVLETGDFISTIAGTSSSITIRCSGREIA